MEPRSLWDLTMTQLLELHREKADHRDGLGYVAGGSIVFSLTTFFANYFYIHSAWLFAASYLVFMLHWFLVPMIKDVERDLFRIQMVLTQMIRDYDERDSRTYRLRYTVWGQTDAWGTNRPRRMFRMLPRGSWVDRGP